jgi:predicted amino acid racemase
LTAPRLKIDLGKIHHNAVTLVHRLSVRGISVTGVTKAALGSPALAKTLLRAGVNAIGDSRIKNLQRMRCSEVRASMVLLRSPMCSQVKEVVAYADVSYNTELEVIRRLSSAAKEAGRMHGVVLMVELGDLREGIMPDDLLMTARETLRFPNISLRGIGTNLACRSGVIPDAGNMAELSALAGSVESSLGRTLDIVSGGNSANLNWALGDSKVGRINNLRLGESILLGCEPLYRKPIEGLSTDAFTLFAEVIESKAKPSSPRGEMAQTAFGKKPHEADRGEIRQTIVALGRQDTDPDGLLPPQGHRILGASSDHLILDSGQTMYAPGEEISFQLNYSALMRSMTSPFVAKLHGSAEVGIRETTLSSR